MKLKNKKTGEIGELSVYIDGHVSADDLVRPWSENTIKSYNSLAELNKEWEDASEEPKGIQCIYYVNHFDAAKLNGVIVGFETKEEAEKAVEKLKTLDKLCRKGLEFNGVEMFGSGFIRIEASIPINEKTTLQERSDITDSLYLLFGGEE